MQLCEDDNRYIVKSQKVYTAKDGLKKNSDMFLMVSYGLWDRKYKISVVH